MNETEVQTFWNAHPCGDHIVGGLHGGFDDDYERFFQAYDSWRYDQEAHILRCLDQTSWQGKRVLEIGLGQGAESEQLIRRGALWSGLDLTQESVDRVGARLSSRGLSHENLRQGASSRSLGPMTLSTSSSVTGSCTTCLTSSRHRLRSIGFCAPAASSLRCSTPAVRSTTRSACEWCAGPARGCLPLAPLRPAA